MTRRETVLARLAERRVAGGAIVVAGVGSGLTAAAAAAGGADALACYGTAAYRILGVPTALAFLPYDDTNALTLELVPTIVERAGATPVIAGLGAHDPRRSLERLVDAAATAGAAGVISSDAGSGFDGSCETTDASLPRTSLRDRSASALLM